MTQETGILAYGAYVPRLRLQRKAIAAANGWFNPALRGQARGERAIANWDEDSITMSVEAARDCLAGADRGALAAVVMASTTHPFDDRQNAGVVANALNLQPQASIAALPPQFTGTERWAWCGAPGAP